MTSVDGHDDREIDEDDVVHEQDEVVSEFCLKGTLATASCCKLRGLARRNQ